MFQKTKVFVGSLPQGVKPDELRRMFENFGTVIECDVMNRCGFVHMQSEEMAESAIKALNNSLFKGVNICVEHGRMKERNNDRGGKAGGPRGGGKAGGGRGGFNRGGNDGKPNNMGGGGGPQRNGMGGGRFGDRKHLNNFSLMFRRISL